MRKILAAGLALTLATLMVPASSAEDVGSQKYVPAMGVRVNHGLQPTVPYSGLGLSWCVFSSDELGTSYEDLTGGCMGGSSIPTSEAEDMFAAGEDGDAVDATATRYLVMEMSIVDDLSGANVFASVCNYHPDYNQNSDYNWCDDGEIDGRPDASAAGCGLALRADATGVHTGNWYAVGFSWTISADPATNEVCIGTTGAMNVLFSAVS